MPFFLGPVKSFSAVKMFARDGEGGRQYLIFGAEVDAGEKAVAVLPLPVAPRTTEEDVRFFDFEAYPNFFLDLDTGFPGGIAEPRPPGSAQQQAGQPQPDPPPVATMKRRYFPDRAAWAESEEFAFESNGMFDAGKQYADYGFVVCLIPAGRQRLTPLAFDFPRKKPNGLFFPLAAEGKQGASAQLYAQPSPGSTLREWAESKRPANFYVQTRRTSNVIDPKSHYYRKVVKIGEDLVV